MGISTQVVTLRGSLSEHRVFTADGWGVGTVALKGKADVSVVGKLLNVRVGDTIELVGEYVEHPRFGQQFKVRSCTPVQPDSLDGVVRWMSSRLPDIGESRARDLVERFGDSLWTVIEADCEKLTEVKGITVERAHAIAEAYKKVAAEREQMVKLRGWGLTDNQVAKCLMAWGDLENVVDKIKEDPYELAQVVDGFGFKKSDRVALAMGIARDAPSRVRAGILYVLDCGASEGHCFLWGARLRDVSAELLGVPQKLVIDQIWAVCEMKRIVRRGARVFATRLDRAEQRCADRVNVMLQLPAEAA